MFENLKRKKRLNVAISKAIRLIRQRRIGRYEIRCVGKNKWVIYDKHKESYLSYNNLFGEGRWIFYGFVDNPVDMIDFYPSIKVANKILEQEIYSVAKIKIDGIINSFHRTKNKSIVRF